MYGQKKLLIFPFWVIMKPVIEEMRGEAPFMSDIETRFNGNFLDVLKKNGTRCS